MASVENKQIPSRGRPLGLTRQAAQKRRQQIYNMHLMGFSETEIGQSMRITRSAVCQHIRAARSVSGWSDKTAKQRFTDLLQLTFDQVRLSQNQAWKLFHDPSNESKPEVRSNLLARVQAGTGLLTRLVPDAQALYIEELVAKVGADQRMIEKWFEEKNMQKRILPVQTGS